MSGYVLHVDESYQWKLLSVGGFLCALDDLPAVRKRWAELRLELGVKQDEELKWNWGQNDPVRLRVEKAGWSKTRRNAAVVRALREMPITLMADLLYDIRVGTERTQLDFYRWGFDYVCVGFRCECVYQRGSSGPHLVVVDKPSAAQRPKRGHPKGPSFGWLKDREEIWHVHYRKLFWEGPKGSDTTPLYQHNFYPALLVSQAKYNRLLEVADAVAGLSLDFVQYNLQGFEADGELPPKDWPDELYEQLAHKFRRGPNGMVRHYGFTLFPERVPGAAEVSHWLDRLS